MIEKFYTEKGIEALKNRLKNWIRVLNCREFPLSEQSLGFGKFEIKTEEELIGRIKELAELTGTSIEIMTEETKAENKLIKIKRVEHGK